jgi:hypothetical protein
MQVVTKGGYVYATHSDGQVMDAVSSYGEGATLYQTSNNVLVFDDDGEYITEDQLLAQIN